MRDSDPQFYALVNDPLTHAQYASLFVEGTDVTGRADPPTSKYLADSRTLYFSIPSFMYDEGVDPHFSYFADRLREFPQTANVIFDLRGNGGGYAGCWRNIVSQFEQQVVWNRSAFFLNTADARACLDLARIDYRMIDCDSAACPDFVRQKRLKIEAFYSKTFPSDAFVGQRCQSPAKRWVLIDGDTFSSGDEFASFCMETGWATVVGHEHTRGDGLNFFGPKWFQLPNTGLLMQTTAGVAFNCDGALNALGGCSNFTICPPRFDALDYVLGLISSDR